MCHLGKSNLKEFRLKKIAAVLLGLLPLAAQAPPGWDQQSPLGSDLPGEGFWHGAGIWAGDHHGPAPTLTDSLGLGNALIGEGFHLEGGYRKGPWDLAAEVLGNRNTLGQSYLTLYRSHIWYRGERGWQGGFEQEPMVWGYGLNGGYTLGEAARPFPRLRIQSPMADLHFFRMPLGTWGWQAFMGRLENHPVLSSSMSNLSYSERFIAEQGNPEAPFINGYRIQATFGQHAEWYLNLVDLWGGTRNGQAMTNGYNLGQYVTSMLGIKDALNEAGSDYSNPSVKAPTTLSVNAQSASEIDTGFRLQAPGLARAVGADTWYLYLSHASKSALWPVKVFLNRPFYYGAKDFKLDMDDLVLKPNYGAWWTTSSRYTLPSLNQANDTVGIQVSWPRVRAGLEYYACVDDGANDGGGFRPFTHGTYVTGFYYYGDPLGNALGGEVIATTAKVEVDYTSRLAGATTLTRGFRPFRDNLADWQQDHPGDTPGKDRFTSLQQTLAWRQSARTTLGLGAAWQREQAVLNVTGVSSNGFAWFADMTFRWPVRS